MNINTSRFMERFLKVGVVVDDRGKDPQQVVRPRVQYMDQSGLQMPDEANWTHCMSPTQPQIFGKNGQKFGDGEHGIGETPNNFLKGSIISAVKGTSSDQETFCIGCIPTLGKGQGSS